MTTLLLLGGHTVEVKATDDEVEERLRKAGWTTTYYERQAGELPRETMWTYDEPQYAVFEGPDGRHPVRVRTDSVVGIV